MEYTWKEIVEYAKKNSSFYSNFYQDRNNQKLSDLPIVDQSVFWKSLILTDDKPDGLVFKSGGSTGVPKYSYFTNKEWETFTKVFGWGISQGIIEDGDKVANLFYVGDLYASFLFIKDSLQSIPMAVKKISQFPIAGATDSKSILKTLEEFSINVLAGVPTATINLLENYSKEEYPNIKIDKFLFGGESLYPDQYLALKKIFPEIKIASIGYASVDAGLLGFVDESCEMGEHRMYDGANIIEIVDPDSGDLITKTNRVGKVLVTNLTRKLMPIIRYPVGDNAMWVEEENLKFRKFKLAGRSDEAARLGTISVYFEDTRLLLLEVLKNFKGLQFQMILNHFENKDQLILKLSGHGLDHSDALIKKITDAFIKDKKVYQEVLEKKLIHPLKVEIVSHNQLEFNLRTGKIKRIIDNRI